MRTMTKRRITFYQLLLLSLSSCWYVQSFTFTSTSIVDPSIVSRSLQQHRNLQVSQQLQGPRYSPPCSSWSKVVYSSRSTALFANNRDDDNGLILNPSDQTVIGVAGSVAALVTFWSEYVLKTTGCGLPAGPAGLLGAAEGISYLIVVAIVGASLYNKVKTGSGLPAGPSGVLGAAEGLSFLSIAVGILVLVFQITDYGYIPNAVPIEGGICS